MPIANCYIKAKHRNIDFQKMTEEWAKLLEVNKKDITLNIIAGEVVNRRSVLPTNFVLKG